MHTHNLATTACPYIPLKCRDAEQAASISLCRLRRAIVFFTIMIMIITIIMLLLLLSLLLLLLLSSLLLSFAFCFSLKAKNVTINALGIGHDIDDDTLNEIAGKNGKVYMVHDYDKLIA